MESPRFVPSPSAPLPLGRGLFCFDVVSLALLGEGDGRRPEGEGTAREKPYLELLPLHRG
jgi:hypothetical protein